MRCTQHLVFACLLSAGLAQAQAPATSNVTLYGSVDAGVAFIDSRPCSRGESGSVIRRGGRARAWPAPVRRQLPSNTGFCLATKAL